MKLKSVIIGILIVVGLTVIFNYADRSSEPTEYTFNDQLLIIEDSVYDNLTKAEITQLQQFANRAVAAANGEPSIYSPHAKFLDNGAILAYMLFVNNTGEIVTELHGIDVALVAGNNELIADAIFPNIKNMPPVNTDSCFLFAVVFQSDAVKKPNADLSSYMTQIFFDYTTHSDTTQ